MPHVLSMLHRCGGASYAHPLSRLSVSGARWLAAAATISVMASMTGEARGQVGQTWVGGTDANWSTAANWGGTLPTQGATTTLTFGIVTGTTILNQDLGTPFVLNALQFVRSNTASQYTIAGGDLLFDGANALINFGGTTTSLGAYTQTIATNVVIGGSALSIIATGTNGNILRFTGTTISTTGNSVTLTLGGSSTGANTILSTIQNDISIQKTGAGLWILSGNNTFTGGVSVQMGTLRITNSNALGLGTNLYLGTTNSSGVLSFLTPAGNTAVITKTIILAGLSGTGIGTLNSDGGTTTTVVVNGTILAEGAFRTLQLAGSNTTGVNVINSFITDGGGTLGLIKASPVTWALTNTANNFTGGVTISAGALRLAITNGVIQGIGANNLRFAAAAGGQAVLESNGTLTVNLGSGVNELQWGATTSNGGGFAAGGGALTVLLNATGDTNLIWNVTPGFTKTNSELQFGSTSADSLLEFQNPINLSNGNRVIRLSDNTTTSNDLVYINSVISSETTGGLTLLGTGTLMLNGNNTYQSGTTLNSGTVNVILRGNNALGSGLITSTGGQLVAGVTPITLTNNILLSGAIAFGGNQTLTIAGLTTITSAAGGTRTISFNNTAGTIFNSSLTIGVNTGTTVLALAGTAGSTAFINGNLLNGTGTAIVTYTGATFVLGGSNNYIGGTTISAGRVIFSDYSAFGTGPLALNGGTLAPTVSGTISNTFVIGGTVTITGAGLNMVVDSPGITLMSAGTGTLTTNLGSLTFNDEFRLAGNLTLLGGPTLITMQQGLSLTGATAALTLLNNNTTTLIINNGINLSADTVAHNLTLRGAGVGGLTVNGAITDGNTPGGSITIISGTVILNGSNLYTGGTTLQVGVLGVGTDLALGSGTLTVTGTQGLLRAENGPRTLTNFVVVGGNFTLTGNQSLTLAGNMTVSGGNRTITLANASTTSPMYMTGTLRLGETGTDRALVLTGVASTQVFMMGNILNGTSATQGSISYAVAEYVLGGVNTYGGLTSIVSGTITLATDSAFGSSTLAVSGGTIKANDLPRGFGNNIMLLGNLAFAGTQALTLTGNITASAARTITANDTGGTIINTITLNPSPTTFALTLAGNSSLTVSGLISQGTLTDASVSITNTGGVSFLANNTYGGPTTLGGAATLFFGNGTGTAGNLSGTLNVSTSSSRVVFNYNNMVSFGLTSTANIVGAGGVEINSTAAGGLIYDRVNTYTGITTITQGTLRLNVDNAVALTSTMMVNGTGTLDLNGHNLAVTTLSNGIGGGGFILNNTSTAVLLTLTQGFFSGTISGGANLGLVKLGAGTLTLGGGNSFSGLSTLGGGTLVVGNSQAIGSGDWNIVSGTLQSDAARTLNNNLYLFGNLTLSGAQTLTLGGMIVLSGSDRQILNSNVTTSMAISGGTILLSNDATPRTLTLTGAAASILLVNSTISDGTAPGGAVAYTGGTFLVGGANTYSGFTSVISGTVSLLTNTAFGSGEVRWTGGTLRADDAAHSVANNVTLLGNMAIAGTQTVTLLGTISSSLARTITVNNTAGAILGPISIGPSSTGSASTVTIAGAGPVTLTGVISQISPTNMNVAVTNTGGVRVLADNTLGGNFSAGANVTLTFGDGVGTAGNLSGTLNLTGGGRAIFNYGSITTFGLTSTANIIGTAGSVEIRGPGVRFDKTNTYTGTTTLVLGTKVIVAATNALGTGAIQVLGNNTLEVEGGPRSMANAVALFGDLNVTGTQTLTISGLMTNSGGNRTLVNNNIGGLAIGSANLSETGGDRVLTVAGGGTVLFIGTVANGTTGTGSLLITNTSGTGVVFGGNATYTGMTTVAAGARLQIGNGAAAGSLLGNVTLSDVTSRLAFNRTGTAVLTYTGVISGLGSVELVGTNTISLSSANTYSGSTTLQSGTLQIANNQALGDSQLYVLNGSLMADAVPRTLTNAIHILGTLTLTGAATSNLTLSTVIDGSGGLAVTGGTNILNAFNTFSGQSTLAGGMLVLQNNHALGDANWFVSGGTLRNDTIARTLTNNLTASGSLTLTGDSALTFGGSLSLSGGNFTLTNNIPTATVALNGPITLGDPTAARVLNLSGAATGSTIINGLISDGTVTGGSVAYSVGNFLITGNNTYSGLTSILSGTLTLGANSPFGSGEIRWTGGALQPDSSARTLTNSLVTLLGNVVVGGSQQLTITGTLAASAARTVTINNTAGLLLNNISLSGNPAAFVLTFNGPGAVTITGVITQQTTTNTGVVFTNTGGATLLNNNLYGGNTTVSAGVTLTMGNGIGSFGQLSSTLNLVAGSQLVLNYGSGTTTYGLTSSGVINGAGNVLIAGASDAVIAFDKANGYTGITTLSQGTIRYGIANALSGASTLVLNSSGTLDLNGFSGGVTTLSDGAGGGGWIVNTTGSTVLSITQGSFSGTISGTGIAFQKLGAGTLTLNTTPAFTQPSTLAGGTVVLSNDLALGTADYRIINTAALQSTGGPLTLSNNFTLAGNLQINGSNTFNIVLPINATVGTHTLIINNTGPTNINSLLGNVTITNRTDFVFVGGAGSELIIGNIDRGTGTTMGITVTGGAGLVRFTGTANPLGVVVAGDMKVIFQGGNNSFGTTATPLTLSNNALVSLSGSNQDFTAVNAFFDTTRITNSGTTESVLTTKAGTILGTISDGSGIISLNKTGTAALILGNNNSFTGNITIAAGTVQIGNGGPTGSVQSAAITNSGALIWNSTAAVTYSGAMTGTGTMTVTGGGSYVFTGAVTYTGATTIGNNTSVTFSGGTNRGVGNGATIVMNNAALNLQGANIGNGTISLAIGSRLTGSGTANGVVTANFGSDVFLGSDGTQGILTLNNLVLAGGSLNFDLGSLSDMLVLTTTSAPSVTLSSFLNLVAGSGFSGGVTYTLFSGYGGTITNTSLNQLVINGPAGYSYTLTNAVGSLRIEFLQALQKVWTGTSSNIWDVNSTANFTLSGGGGPVVYFDGDAVIFDDTAVVTDITISNGGAAVVPTSVLVVNTAQTYTFRGDPIGGANGLDKQGTGILVLANDNTFTGAVQISGGTLQLGDGGATGSITPTLGIQLENDSLLLVNRSGTISLTGNITGSGNLIKTGPGTLNVSGTNTYLGNTTILGGTLQVSRGTLPTIATSILTVSGNGSRLVIATPNAVTAPTITVTNQGRIDVNSGGITVGLLNMNSGVVNINATTLTVNAITMTGAAGQSATFNLAVGTTLSLLNNVTYDSTGDPLGAAINGPGTLNLGAVRNITVSDSAAVTGDDAELTIGAFMTAASAFNKQGAGMLYLTGSNAINASTTISAGTVMLGNNFALGVATIQFVGGAIRGDGISRTIGNAVNVRGSASIGGNSELNLTGTWQNVGNNTLTIDNSALTRFGNLLLGENNQARTLSIGGSGSVEFLFISAGSGTGNDNLIFNGTGTYDLLGANTQSGTVSVRNGTVRVFNQGAFGPTPGQVVNLGGGTSANPVLLTIGAMDLTQNINVVASTTSVLAFGNLSAVTSTFSGTISLAASTNIITTDGGTVVISGTVSGAGGFTKTGNGTLIVSGINSFSGVSTLQTGLLRLGSNSALGLGNIRVNLGTTLDLNGFATTLTTIGNGTDGGGLVTSAVAGAIDLTIGSGVFSGVISDGSGTLSLNKTTTGTLVLGGDNTYTGVTTIGLGTLQIGNGGTAGSIASQSIVNNSLLTFNRTDALTYGGVISGTGGVQITAGSITLAADNTYAGATTISAGTTLNLGNGGAAGSVTNTISNAGLLTFNHNTTVTVGQSILGAGGVLVQGGGVTFTGVQTYTGMTTIAAGASLLLGGTNGNLTGSVTANGLLSFNAAVTYGGVISGSGGVLINAATVTLTNANSFTGLTTIAAGNNLILSGTVSSLAGGIQNEGLLTFNRGGTSSLTYDQSINGGGAVSIATGSVAFSGAGGYTGLTTIASGATLLLTGTAGNLTGSVANFGTFIFDRTGTYNGNVSGTGVFRVTSGTATFGGIGTYTGATQVNGGSLIVTGTLGATSVTVAAGATLAGSGTLGGAVNVLASGNLAGTVTVAAAVTSSGSINPGGLGVAGTLTMSTLILNGGTLNFDLGTIGLGTSDRIVISTTTAPTVSTTTLLNFSQLAGFSTGTYSIFSGYTGTLATANFNRLFFNSITGYSLTLQNSAGSLNLLVALLPTQDLVWTGSASNVWDLSSLNWSGAVSTFSNGVGNVTFDNSTAVNSITVTDAGVSPVSMTVNNDLSHSYIFSGGNITGTTATSSLFKTGAGSLVFGNNVTFSGGAVINAGTLQIGNGTTSGSFNGNIVNNAAIVFSRTDAYSYGNVISGTGTVQVGGGQLTLGGTNTYSGATQIASGATLFVNGGIASSSVTVAAGAVLAGTGNVGGSVDVAATGALSGSLTIGGTVTSSGSINPGGIGTVGVLTINTLILNGGTLNFDIGTIGLGNSDRIVITGSVPTINAATTLSLHSLAGFGDGLYTLYSGYTGTLDVGQFNNLLLGSLSGYSLTLQNNSGSLDVLITLLTSQNLVWTGSTNGSWDTTSLNWAGTAVTFTNGSANVTFDNSSAVNAVSVTSSGVSPITMTVNNDGSHNYVFSGGNITGATATSSLYKDGAGTLTFGNNVTFSGGAIVNGGMLQIGSGTAGSFHGNILNNAVVAFSRATASSYDGVISGTGGVVVDAGTLTLSGTNTYSGETQIGPSANVIVNGGITSSTVTVTGNAVLRGSGTIGGSVNIGASGNLTGSLTIAGVVTSSGTISPGGNINVTQLTLNTLILNGGTLNFDLGTIGLGTSDRILFTGVAPTINGTTTINLATFAGFGDGLYTLFSGYTGTIGSGFGNLLMNSLSGYTLTLQNNSGSLDVLVTFLASQNLVWTGSTNGSWDTTSLNWAGTAVTFTNNGSNVTFGNGTGVNNIAVDLGGVSPLSMTVSNDSSHNYIFTGGPIISVSNLYKDGDGMLVFATGASFAAGATVNGGVLQIGNGGAGGTFFGNIVNNASVVFNSTSGFGYLAQISGTGDVTILTGTVSFGTQTYSGATTVASGATLQALANIASPTINVAGLLQFNTIATQTYSGVLAGSGFLQKLGTGTTFLTGANTFNGITSIDAGTLYITQALSGTIYVNSGGAFSGTSSGSLVLQGGSGSITSTQSGALTVNTGTVTIASGGATTGSVNVGGGTLVVQSGGSVGNTLGVNITGGSLNVNSGGAIVGSGQTFVSGGGTLVANGNVSGLVNVNSGGTLQGNGGTVGAAVVNSGGTLSPGNSVGTLTIDGVGVSGGASVTLNGGSNVVFEFNNATGTAGGGASGGWDYIDLVSSSGTLYLNASGSSKINLRIDSLTFPGNVHGAASNFNNAPGTVGNVQEYFWKFVGLTDSSKLVLAPGGSVNGRFTITDAVAGNGVFFETGSPNGNPFQRPVSALGQGTFKVLAGDYGSGYGLYVWYSAIPEPSSMILAGLGSLAAGWYGRRRLRKRRDEAAAAAAQEPAPPSSAIL